MSTFTVSVTPEIKKKLDAFPEINWSEYLKKRFQERILTLKKLKNN